MTKTVNNKDFIIGALVSPAEAVRKVKIILGEQKSYRLEIKKDLYNAKELIKDLPRYLDMRVVDVQEEVGKKLSTIFEKRKWTNGDGVVYGTLLCMAREMYYTDDK